MEQQRPALSQSPLRMHNNKNSGSSNNFSQKQLGALPNNSNHKASPIRESLIKNTGAFILGNGGNQGTSQGASGGTAANNAMTQQPSSQQLLSNFNTTGAAAAGGNSDLTNLAASGNPTYTRDRSADRAGFDYDNAKDMSGQNAPGDNRGDVLDNFMSLPKQQQMQIQMLTEQQQMAYITQHRAETSGVKMHNSNHGHFNQLNSATFRGVPPSSGGTGAAAIAFNPLHQHQQQSSQPILHTTSKYGVGPSQPVIQARQSQVPQFTGIAQGGTNGDSGSFSLQRNTAGGLLTDSAAAKKTNQTLQNSPQKNGGGAADTIKNKRVFIENTVDSILHTKTNKTSSFMNKPVGAMSGTGTTDVHPKVHSVSPRNNVGSSIVGLPNIIVGQAGAASGATQGAATTNVSQQNRSGGVSPTKDGSAAAAAGGPQGDQGRGKNAAESQQPQRAADASRQVDDFLAETDKMTFI